MSSDLTESPGAPPRVEGREVLVIGSGGHVARSMTWDKLLPVYVADFKVVVVNLSTLPPLHERVMGPLPSPRQFAHLWLRDDSEIVVIGSPRRRFRPENGEPHLATWWAPFDLSIEEGAGTNITDVDQRFAYYFDRLRTWAYFFSLTYNWTQPPEEWARPAIRDGIEAGYVSMEALASTHFGKAIAIEIKLHLQEMAAGGFLHDVASSSPLFWLPRLNGLSPEECVDLVLAERYGLRREQPPPAWVEPYVLPSHRPLISEVKRLSAEAEGVQADLARAQDAEIAARRWRRLLYERDEALEPLVRDALSELGGEVTAPDRKGIEDGRVVDPTGHKLILEVKSRAGAAKLDDVRQLQDWVTAALTDESQDWEGTGLLVECTFADTPIGERGEAFPHNTRKRAESFRQALLTTTQLFQALADHQDGRLSTDEFWRSIREAAPLCDLPELEQAPAGDSPSHEPPASDGSAADQTEHPGGLEDHG